MKKLSFALSCALFTALATASVIHAAPASDGGFVNKTSGITGLSGCFSEKSGQQKSAPFQKLIFNMSIERDCTEEGDLCAGNLVIVDHQGKSSPSMPYQAVPNALGGGSFATYLKEDGTPGIVVFSRFKPHASETRFEALEVLVPGPNENNPEAGSFRVIFERCAK